MMTLTPVQSSNVEAVGYDPKQEELHVRFKGGALYIYSGVSEREHQDLMRADSIGKHLNAHIKPVKACRKEESAVKPAPVSAKDPDSASLDEVRAALACAPLCLIEILVDAIRAVEHEGLYSNAEWDAALRLLANAPQWLSACVRALDLACKQGVAWRDERDQARAALAAQTLATDPGRA